MGLFNQEKTRTAFARARSHCIVAEISYHQFKTAINCFTDLMFLITSQIAQKLCNTTAKVRELAFMDVSG